MTANNYLVWAASKLAERGTEYDRPAGERSMADTVAAFNALTGHNLSETEGWMFMGLLKFKRMLVSQAAGKHHDDSAGDAVAYAALAAESAKKVKAIDTMRAAP